MVDLASISVFITIIISTVTSTFTNITHLHIDPKGPVEVVSKDVKQKEASSSAKNAVEVQVTVTNIPTNTPTQTPRPTFAAISTPTSTPLVKVNSFVVLDSVFPSSAINNQTIILKGKGFGSKTGNVWFFNSFGNSGGPSIDSWSDTEIHTKVLFVGKGSFYLQVQTADGAESNKIPFTVLAGQPYAPSLSPVSGSKATQFTINGSELGSAGSVNFYKSGSSGWDALVGAASIQSWSDTEIKFIPPSSVENREYGIQIVTSDGRGSSFKYLTITN